MGEDRPEKSDHNRRRPDTHDPKLKSKKLGIRRAKKGGGGKKTVWGSEKDEIRFECEDVMDQFHAQPASSADVQGDEEATPAPAAPAMSMPMMPETAPAGSK
jgi:hypothetical protein